ncbi:MAG TPA: acyl-CoA synthetase [Acidimicrobiales bacterium]|nr:acyl-CoA synthetase [Acidimicrobiales bacterium]
MAEPGFWAIATEDPTRLALVEPDGREVSAGELLASANQLVHGLRERGLRPGDAIAMVLPNGAEVFELYLAALQAGWYLVPINHHLVGPEIAYIVADCEAKAFIGHERFAEACAAAADEIGVPKEARFAVSGGPGIPGFHPYEELKEGQSGDTPSDRTTGAVMNYTSGTTGQPKGIRRPLPGVAPEVAAVGFGGILQLFGIQPRDDNVHLVGSPLYHTAVLTFSGAAIHLAHTVVVMDKWTPESCLERIEKYRVTHSHMVPTQFHRLLALPPAVRANYDVSSLRHMIHAAAPCPPDVKRQMIEWWGNAVDEYYAASEGGGTLVTAEEWMRKPGTVGKAWPMSEIAVFDDDGNRVKQPNQIGTVYMSMQRGDFEYYKDKDKTRKNRIGPFFTVGDVGYLDDDGYLFLCDRKADMIISGGANIYPAEIENVLLSHPNVADAAVFGIPHEDWGEEVKAVIEPAAGAVADSELADDILAFCAGRLARFKTPKSIDFIVEMPRDPNGKLYKRKLRDPYWAGRERAI